MSFSEVILEMLEQCLEILPTTSFIDLQLTLFTWLESLTANALKEPVIDISSCNDFVTLIKSQGMKRLYSDCFMIDIKMIRERAKTWDAAINRSIMGAE